MLNSKISEEYEAADQVLKEKMRKRALEKATKKCLKEKVFTFVSCANDEDDMECILEEFTYEELIKINQADFRVGYRKDDVADKMDFVNKLPLEFKYKLIEEIE